MNWRERAASEAPRGARHDLPKDFVCRASNSSPFDPNRPTYKGSPGFTICSHSAPLPPTSPLDLLKLRKSKSGAQQMNKTEARYATLLEGLRLAGEIVDWQYEAITLKLGPDCRYTPDFLVIVEASLDVHPKIEFHEVKGGFTREDSLVKIKSASQQFPWFTFKLCRYQKGKWDIKGVK